MKWNEIEWNDAQQKHNRITHTVRKQARERQNRDMAYINFAAPQWMWKCNAEWKSEQNKEEEEEKERENNMMVKLICEQQRQQGAIGWEYFVDDIFFIG